MSQESIADLKQSSPVAKIFDFSEKLSPMLVKELRQGLRSVGFTSAFLTMQAILLCVLLIVTFTGNTSAVPPQSISMAIFVIFTIVACGIQPLRAINAIGAEIKADTIDLVVLTQLNAWKIVFGKWVSLMAQTLLFGVSLFPYLIMRYFLGGMELLEEVTLFYLIFIVAGTLTALAVGLSAIRLAIIRYIISGGFILFGGIYSVTAVAGFIIVRNQTFFTSALNIQWQIYIYTAFTTSIIALYMTWMLLDFGATMIAPISENRSTKRRLIYLSMLLVGLLAFFGLPEIFSTPFLQDDDYRIMIQCILGLLFIPFFITTITEHTYLAPRICRQLKNSKLIYPLRYVLYPGWATGAFFLAFCIAIHTGLLFFTGGYGATEFALFVLSCIGSLLFPATITILFGKNSKSLLSFYLITLLATGILSIMVTIFAEATIKEIALFFIWNPSVALYIMADNVIRSDELTITLLVAFNTLFLVLILVRSGSIFREIRKQEKYSQQDHIVPKELQ